MPFYKIVGVRSGRPVGTIEAEKRGKNGEATVLHASLSFEWAVGKKTSQVGEWCNRKGMAIHPITEQAEKDKALAELHRQGKLALTNREQEK